MKLLKIIFLISLLIPSLNAQEYKQILIAKTSKAKNLKVIKSQLAKLNIGISIKKRKSYFLIYSKKSTKTQNLEFLLQKIKPYFPSAIIVTVNQYKKNLTKNIKKENKKAVQTEELPKRVPTFVSFGLGLNSISGKTDNLLASKLNNNNTSYSLEAGYYYDENIFFSVGYLNSFTSDISLDSLYTSANYALEATKEVKIYFGGLFGLSILRLNDYADASDSTSFLFGGVVGVNYEVYKDIELFSAYQALSINHNVALKSSSIEFSFIHNAQFGVKYNF